MARMKSWMPVMPMSRSSAVASMRYASFGREIWCRSVTERMTELVTRINLTNAATVSDGETVTALIARRDCMTKKINILRGFLDEASSTVSRGMRSEIKIKSTVNVREYQKLLDELSKELRTLDVRLQGLNFTTELL